MEISRADISQLAPLPYVSVTDVEHLASYNWIEAPTPTIVVPGLPSTWRGINTPRQLKKDNGLIYVAQNAARNPESPMEPLFRALYVENPAFDISAVDIVSDRNNIRKLLSFIEPSSSVHGVKSFTMRMEVVNEVVFLHREETLTQEFIGPDDFKGYGHEFEKAYTKNEISRSTGHHRVVSYRFGGLRFIVRHETDGCVEFGGPTQLEKEVPAENALSGLLESLSISQPKTSDETKPAGSKLTVRKEGRKIAPQSTLEIKTRVRHKPLSVADVAPQLWISQTPKLVRAYHERGKFKVPVVEDVTSALRQWEKLNQQTLRRLAALLARLVAAGKQNQHSTITHDARSDRLHVERCEGRRMFPADLYEKWAGAQTSEQHRDQKRDTLLPHLAQVSAMCILLQL